MVGLQEQSHVPDCCRGHPAAAVLIPHSTCSPSSLKGVAHLSDRASATRQPLEVSVTTQLPALGVRLVPRAAWAVTKHSCGPLQDKQGYEGLYCAMVLFPSRGLSKSPKLQVSLATPRGRLATAVPTHGLPEHLSPVDSFPHLWPRSHGHGQGASNSLSPHPTDSCRTPGT